MSLKYFFVLNSMFLCLLSFSLNATDSQRLTYTDIYEIADITAPGVITFNNTTNEDIIIKSSIVTKNTNIKLRGPEGTKISSSPIKITAGSSDFVSLDRVSAPNHFFFENFGSQIFEITGDYHEIKSTLYIGNQVFELEFWKESFIPMSTIRSLLGYREKNHGWVLKATEIFE
ncbi:MAG: hypothetical protein GW748_07835 [Alphaproteobacteria bacterium]|nr:hypothetical protein [Alphaproteobacteria bacterium]